MTLPLFSYYNYGDFLDLVMLFEKLYISTGDIGFVEESLLFDKLVNVTYLSLKLFVDYAIF